MRKWEVIRYQKQNREEKDKKGVIGVTHGERKEKSHFLEGGEHRFQIIMPKTPVFHIRKSLYSTVNSCYIGIHLSNIQV